MQALKIAIDIAWIAFWVYWLASAFDVKEGRGSRRRIPLNGVTALSVVILVRVFRGGSLAVNSPILGAIGSVVFVCGIALAISSRDVPDRVSGISSQHEDADPVRPLDDGAGDAWSELGYQG
jgi:hypothetical protein